MIQRELPRIILGLINCRFDEDYNLKIIYDASCRLKEFGLNRKPKRIMDILVTTDPLHVYNHTSCSESFKSTLYPKMKILNCEACKQFNSLLRNIQQSVTYMTFDRYMRALCVFILFYNLRGINTYKETFICISFIVSLLSTYYATSIQSGFDLSVISLVFPRGFVRYHWSK